MIYTDACILVKWYVEEDCSAEVQAFLSTATELGAAAITLAEVVSAISKQVHRGDIDRKLGQDAVLDVHRGWKTIRSVAISSSIVSDACKLAWKHGLRGYDSVHLASAIKLQRYVQAPITVATLDRELSNAAVAEGLAVWPSDSATFRAVGTPARPA
jgi:predicted nucleic acid-binding protein